MMIINLITNKDNPLKSIDSLHNRRFTKNKKKKICVINSNNDGINVSFEIKSY